MSDEDNFIDYDTLTFNIKIDPEEEIKTFEELGLKQYTLDIIHLEDK